VKSWTASEIIRGQMSSEGYDRIFFQSGQLKDAAKRMLRLIGKLNRGGANIDTVISRGSSGCSIAAAILALSKKEMHHLYIRKPGEDSHGKIYQSGRWGSGKAVIVDDFISTGATITAILDSVPVYDKKSCIVCVLVNDTESRHGDIDVYNCKPEQPILKRRRKCQ